MGYDHIHREEAASSIEDDASIPELTGEGPPCAVCGTQAVTKRDDRPLCRAHAPDESDS